MPTAEAARAWDRTTDLQPWSETTDAVEPSAGEGAKREELRRKIAKAERHLDLVDEAEDEDIGRYSKATLERAAAFLIMHADFLAQYDLSLPIPTIGPGPNGSVDLHWKRRSWELLVNIPAEPTRMATFYGDNYGVQKIKGSVDPKICNVGLAAWLMN